MLKKYDPDLVTLADAQGAVMIAPGLQGRIFCRLGGDLIHRLDVARLDHPASDEFNNLGGHSLWPAPEGGAYAFNYPPGSDTWRVQDGIANAPAKVVAADSRWAVVEKQIQLTNRKGFNVKLLFRRRVHLLPMSETAWPFASIRYRTEDTLSPLEDYRWRDILVAPWSLEQFPGGDGVTAFAKVARSDDAINFDFYGMPEQPFVYGPGVVIMPLGGKAKFQIGVKVSSRPALIGAFDRRRSLLIVRTAEQQDGRYFNIADNAQPNGPWSAADLYSIFNGGEMAFFELETIAPLKTRKEWVCASTLCSTTEIRRGAPDELTRFARECYGVPLA
ncbi:MAG: hypothetical protein HYV36_03260 [Lentisphaerae bacterium]|nr:hypothetical protein [Lentisphaerota bacterium]